jgi:ABC-type nitrate/sulfonate/bicarbonate transport system substrate-binding protein
MLPRIARGLLCTLAACLVAFNAAAEQLRVAVTSAAENAPFFSGVERGNFSKLGVDLKVDVMPSGVEIVNALASGQVDVGLFGTFPFLTAVARGVPLVLIGHTWNNALKNPQSEVLSIVAREGSGIPVGDLAKLKGKKIGVTRGAGGFLRKTLFWSIPRRPTWPPRWPARTPTSSCRGSPGLARR